MAWTVEFRKSADKALQKLSPDTQRRIVHFLRERVLAAGDPRSLGKPLSGPLAELWRYRVGDYRLICSIEDHKMVILVIELGHRKDIYDG